MAHKIIILEDQEGPFQVMLVRVQGKNGQKTMSAQNELPYSRIYGGHGADTDIIVASAKAYINALNKLIISQTEMQTVQNDYGVMLVG